jgi:hypothetical protein
MIPILGRISVLSYLRLIIAYFILLLEGLFRLLSAVLPFNALLDLIRDTFAKKTISESDNEKKFTDFICTEDFIRHW